MLTAKSHD